MDILFLLIPLGLVVIAVAAGGFLWAVKSGQFDDMEGPAHRILMDEDDPRIPRKPSVPLKADAQSDTLPRSRESESSKGRGNS